jgi:bifunctional DNA-binding transcriptional regulator/antitoxin component of YhaV-PrlF toxin-antitoxin module
MCGGAWALQGGDGSGLWWEFWQKCIVLGQGITLLLDGNGNVAEVHVMLIKVTSKRQVTFPAAVLEALGAVPGSHLEIQPRADGFLLRARGINRSKLAPLRSIIAKGTKPFDVEAFREQRHEPENRY